MKNLKRLCSAQLVTSWRSIIVKTLFGASWLSPRHVGDDRLRVTLATAVEPITRGKARACEDHDIIPGYIIWALAFGRLLFFFIAIFFFFFFLQPVQLVFCSLSLSISCEIAMNRREMRTWYQGRRDNSLFFIMASHIEVSLSRARLLASIFGDVYDEFSSVLFMKIGIRRFCIVIEMIDWQFIQKFWYLFEILLIM